MASPASSTTEPPVFELGTTLDLKIPPVAGLEQNQELPFSTGAPFVLPFAGIMRRPPVPPERDISISAADLELWAMAIATAWNL